jgi:hypothetical protein
VGDVGYLSIPELRVITPHRSESASDLHIDVVFTDFEDTGAALKAAAELAIGLQADIELIVPQIVPFPLPLVHPTVPPGFTLRRLMDLASAADVQPSIHVYLCRDRLQTLLQVLEPHSVVVVGSRRRWLPTIPERLARALRKNGHHVILARYPENHTSR